GHPAGPICRSGERGRRPPRAASGDPAPRRPRRSGRTGWGEREAESRAIEDTRGSSSSLPFADIHAVVHLIVKISHFNLLRGRNQTGILIPGEELLPKRLNGARSEALAAFHEISARLVSSLDLDETLVAIARAATQVLLADIGAIFLPDGDGRLAVRGIHGARSPLWTSLRLNTDRGLNAGALD